MPHRLTATSGVPPTPEHNAKLRLTGHSATDKIGTASQLQRTSPRNPHCPEFQEQQQGASPAEKHAVGQLIDWLAGVQFSPSDSDGEDLEETTRSYLASYKDNFGRKSASQVRPGCCGVFCCSREQILCSARTEARRHGAACARQFQGASLGSKCVIDLPRKHYSIMPYRKHRYNAAIQIVCRHLRAFHVNKSCLNLTCIRTRKGEGGLLEPTC